MLARLSFHYTWLRRHYQRGIGLTLVLLYALTRLAGLTALPVFADEAIYIRWAQLITHDARYWFFSLNDGKPPLFIWSLLPAVTLGLDPLWTARLTSGLIGLGQGVLTWLIVRQLGGRRWAQWAAFGLVVITPFWFFSHRIALMDSLLTATLSLSLLGLLKMNQKKTLLGMLVAGLGWGAALWTKTPALFFAPVFFGLAYGGWWLNPARRPALTWRYWWQRTWQFGGAGFIGIVVFLLLRTQPAFGSLFSRSGDFTFTLSEVIAGQWRTGIDNFGRLLQWLAAYLRPEALSLVAIALVLSARRRQHLFLILSGCIFALPLLILGKTLHPRYFLPIALFLTPSIALFWEECVFFIRRRQDQWLTTTFVLVVAFFLVGCLRFLFLAIWMPAQTPLVLADRSQYLTEWSAGYGIPQVRDRLLERARKQQRTTVVTEGSFGTLPDGLLMYFDRRPEIAFLRIEGLAQYPVKFLPEWVKALARQEEVWLMVNENRFALPNDQQASVELIGRYERPYGAPELLVFRIRPE